jgi:hypothetical protein
MCYIYDAFTKTPLEIYFIYLGYKDVYYIFKTCCTMFYFLQNAVYFIILSFSFKVIFTFYTTQVLKFK